VHFCPLSCKISLRMMNRVFLECCSFPTYVAIVAIILSFDLYATHDFRVDVLTVCYNLTQFKLFTDRCRQLSVIKLYESKKLVHSSRILKSNLNPSREIETLLSSTSQSNTYTAALHISL